MARSEYFLPSIAVAGQHRDLGDYPAKNARFAPIFVSVNA